MISILTIFMVGLDNFIVCAGLGTLELSARRQMLLVGLFMVAEMSMTMLGFFAGAQLMPLAWLAVFEWLAPVYLLVIGGLVMGGLVIGGEGVSGRLQRLVRSGSLVFAVPPLMAIDNFIAATGTVQGNSAFGASFLMGLLSAMACVAGLWLGKMVQARVKRRWFSGACITAIGSMMLLGATS